MSFLARRSSLGDLGPWLAGGILVASVALVLMTGSAYNLGRISSILLLALVATGMNLALGYGGQFVLTQVVVLGVSAYTAGLLGTEFGWTLGATFILATLAGVTVGVVVALPGLRSSGWALGISGFLAVVAFGELLQVTREWTHGTDGLVGIPKPSLAGLELDGKGYTLLVLGCVALCVLGARNVVHSGIGLKLMALRDAPHAAAASGVSIPRTKMLLYALNSVPPALAGALTPYANQFLAPQQFTSRQIVLALAAVIIGGRGTIAGPLIGAVFVAGISAWIGPFSEWNALLFGAILIVAVAVLPRGLVALWSPQRRRAGRAPERANPESVGLPPMPASGLDDPSAATPIALRATDVVVAFGEQRVLHEVNLTLNADAILGLTGPNGCGKTTFVNAATGFVPVSSGRIEISGEDVQGKTPWHVARLGVARTFQVPQLISGVSVRDNIGLGVVGRQRSSLFGALFRTPSFRRERLQRANAVRAASSALALPDDLLDRSTDEVSLGTKRIVEIARATAASPHVILLDEPASGLDPHERDELRSALTRARTGHAFLLIEHDIQFLLAVSDDVCLMESGVISVCAAIDDEIPLPSELADYIAMSSEVPNEDSVVESAAI